MSDVRVIPAEGKSRKIPKKATFAHRADTYEGLMERAKAYHTTANKYNAAAAYYNSKDSSKSKKYRDHASIRRVQALDAERKAAHLMAGVLAGMKGTMTQKRGRFTITTHS